VVTCQIPAAQEQAAASCPASGPAAAAVKRLAAAELLSSTWCLAGPAQLNY
jgi:hypothetical protein